MPITDTIMKLIVWLLDAYSIILIIYALMSWVPNLYGTWIGQLIIKVCRPYLSLFEKIPLQFWGLDFTVLLGLIGLQFVRRFIEIIFNGVFY